MDNTFKRIEFNNEYFKENINFLVEKYGIKKKSIEEQLELGQGALSKYGNENNGKKPNIEVLLSIANGFNITIDELIKLDLRKKEIKQIQDSERKDVKFCEKLIDDTNNNSIEWKTANFTQEVRGVGQDYSKVKLGDVPIKNFQGKIESNDCDSFIGTIFAKNDNSSSLIQGFSSIKVYVVKGEEQDKEKFQIYLSENNKKMIKAIPSVEINGEDLLLNDKLRDVYEAISYYVNYGKARFELENIFDSYLNTSKEDLKSL